MYPEDYFDDSDNTFDNSLFDTYTSTTVDLERKFVIPKGTKTIETVEEIEVIGDTTILYTMSGKSYAEHQVESVNVVYDYVTSKEG